MLVREGSLARMETLLRGWGSDRVVPVVGDLSEAGLGVAKKWVDASTAAGSTHFFHLAAIYDMTADDATNETMNVGGTRHALELAAALEAGCFHQVSSVAAAGDFPGPFDETMFDEGQHLPSPYHRTKFESEQHRPRAGAVPWRVYRPAVVVGDSQTGAMDKVDGPYYFFPLIKMLRDSLPAWLPLVGVDLGDTNVVPVDYVAKAMDHLAHLPDRDGEAFHLVNPEPQPVVEMINSFCAAAGAPAVRDAGRPLGHPRRRRARWCRGALRPLDDPQRAGAARAPAQALLDQTVGRLGVPAEVLGAHQLLGRLRLPPHREGAGRLRHRRCPTSSPTPARCGATGRRTSTSRPAATRGSARRSPASTS